MFHKAEQRSRPDSDHPKGKATRFEYGEILLKTDDVNKRFQRANFDMGEHIDLGKAISVFFALTNEPRRCIYTKKRRLQNTLRHGFISTHNTIPKAKQRYRHKMDSGSFST